VHTKHAGTPDESDGASAHRLARRRIMGSAPLSTLARCATRIARIRCRFGSGGIISAGARRERATSCCSLRFLLFGFVPGFEPALEVVDVGETGSLELPRRARGCIARFARAVHDDLLLAIAARGRRNGVHESALLHRNVARARDSIARELLARQDIDQQQVIAAIQQVGELIEGHGLHFGGAGSVAPSKQHLCHVEVSQRIRRALARQSTSTRRARFPESACTRRG